MSRTKKGGKGPGHEFWSKRPISNKHGCSPSKANKRLTHKAERREAYGERAARRIAAALNLYEATKRREI